MSCYYYYLLLFKVQVRKYKGKTTRQSLNEKQIDFAAKNNILHADNNNNSRCIVNLLL